MSSKGVVNITFRVMLGYSQCCYFLMLVLEQAICFQSLVIHTVCGGASYHSNGLIQLFARIFAMLLFHYVGICFPSLVYTHSGGELSFLWSHTII